MFWELSRRRDVMQCLQAEIDEIMPDPRVIPDASVLNKSEYLNAFVKECKSAFWPSGYPATDMLPSPPSVRRRAVPARARRPVAVVAVALWRVYRGRVDAAFG